MRCTACESEAQPGQRFCGYCGQSLSAPCPQCGQENPGDHRFCGGCGAQLTGGPARPAPAEAASVTERRVVSVLFVDLVGFTTLSQHRDPEEVRALVTRYFELAQEVISRFGGTVDKYIGDAVMAWWGATTSNEDDAERAVRAGLELVDRVTTLELADGPELAARGGVMTGEVAVGPGGNERGLLLGDLVNSTSRLQSIAEPGTVYVGETTAALVDKAIELVPAGSHAGRARTSRSWRRGRCGCSLRGAAGDEPTSSSPPSWAGCRSSGCSRTPSTTREGSGGPGWSLWWARPG